MILSKTLLDGRVFFLFFSRIYEFTFLSNPVINEGRGANPIYNGILDTFTYRQNIILSMEGHLKLRSHSIIITEFYSL